MPHGEALAEGQDPKCRTRRGVRATRKIRKTRVAACDSICTGGAGLAPRLRRAADAPANKAAFFRRVLYMKKCIELHVQLEYIELLERLENIFA